MILWRHRVPRNVGKTAATGKSLLNGLEGFWNFARPRLGKFHRNSDKDLYYFLKELAYRYENKDRELFDSLVKLLTQLMPNT
jgi:transposase